ncbi:fibrinogen-like protein 1 [Mytilus edulis]|uniref:fibrinogen-like protein 1 n=1 Tax=Mytilus edulis TaxID=6550 RepID=UPI0039F035C1
MDKDSMVIIILIYGVFVIYPICHGTSSDIKNKMKFILEQEERIVSSDSTITTIKTDSVILCTFLCMSKKECETASYDLMTGQCKLVSDCNPKTEKIETGILVLKYQEPTDCSKMPMGSINGVYKIFTNNRCINVYCDMTDNGWTVIQRRLDGSVDFYREWLDYKKGFGNVSGEYWLGNDNIFNILNGKSHSLRFDLERGSGERSYAQYETFKIADESENYRLTLAGYKGTAGDVNGNVFIQISGQLFSTKDRDNDNWSGGECANYTKAGWWYAEEAWNKYRCTFVNPNGKYNDGTEEESVYWFPWTKFEGMKSVTMKIKHF